MRLNNLRATAVTLLETIAGIFLILSAMLVLVSLFHASLRYQGRAQRQITAVRAAEHATAQIRAWARDPENFRGDWNAYDAKVLVDPAYPDFEILTEIPPVRPVLRSPCTSLELAEAPRDRQMVNSLMPVRVQVRLAGQSQILHSQTTYIGEPTRNVRANTPLEVVRVSGSTSLAADASVTYQAKLYDANDQEIPDLMVSWSVQPVSGNASLDPTSPRDGRQAVLTNRYYQPITNTWAYLPGDVALRATVIYNGVEYSAQSEKVTLLP